MALRLKRTQDARSMTASKPARTGPLWGMAETSNSENRVCELDDCDEPRPNGWHRKLCLRHYWDARDTEPHTCTSDGCDEMLAVGGPCGNHERQAIFRWSVPHKLRSIAYDHRYVALVMFGFTIAAYFNTLSTPPTWFASPREEVRSFRA